MQFKKLKNVYEKRVPQEREMVLNTFYVGKMQRSSNRTIR